MNGAAQLGRGQVYIHVNGGREDNNNYLIDGITVADYAFGELTYTPLPSPDAIQEFKVSTSLYDATQGRNGGGNINATLKSGSAKFHGDLWEYFRNTSLDANDYFLGKVVIKQNIFGGDIGGPIGPGAKLGYFYFNLQGTRQRSGDSPGTFINTQYSLMSPPLGPRVRCCVGSCRAESSTVIDPVAFNLMNATGNQFGAARADTCSPLPPTPAFNHASSHYGPFLITDPGRFSDNQFTANWDREFRGRERPLIREVLLVRFRLRLSLSAPILMAFRPAGSPA